MCLVNRISAYGCIDSGGEIQSKEVQTERKDLLVSSLPHRGVTDSIVLLCVCFSGLSVICAGMCPNII